ncbi:MAG: succinate dehydrogenase iron-sulfur subunit [Armatimonadota bacterium]|nr:succinate dehydrogenase iron-sulfur subunit [Armatimonadota bacterium]MDR7440027.1 succinate dehydrogenase iron-sulfur subunit [Armatimonadota bacterium]MDR7562502.1 succinate dehydrogenase iron-sulfur subunit [Armatimonadota bacterium]MDR7566799.1 succinate dehydrogenase iron-sulfur subunit [Armatimonadota bacterium]MDR7601386.1 succinate dehydrogenase iron-sulfur subunit [Armatimonadota bacterium]
MKAIIRIKRYNPEVDRRPYWAEYEVPVDPFDRVLDALHYIKANIDGSLALRRSCAHGICGSDAMLINGRNRLACKVLVKDLGLRITVEPLRGLRVIKDLVVDMEPFFQKYRQVMPWLITDEPPPPQERRQTPEERARYEDTTKCILCAVCTTACPIFWGTGEFLGPAALVAAHRFVFDSRDQAAQQRLQILADRSGVFKCRTVFNCTEACPQGIEITKAIQELKQAIILSRT